MMHGIANIVYVVVFWWMQDMRGEDMSNVYVDVIVTARTSGRRRPKIMHDVY